MINFFIMSMLIVYGIYILRWGHSFFCFEEGVSLPVNAL
jgi:hypothetical protein